MDTSASDTSFDERGVCNHCRRAEEILSSRLSKYRVGVYRIDRVVDLLKAAGAGRPYDCIVGVSGGADSTYAAYTVRKLGLRPLAVHFDNGWDSELAVQNIENTLRHMGIPLFTHVVDWPEFRDLQLSFLKASVPDAEVPTDHGIWALLYQTAARFGVKYIISGTNLNTESILPRSWTYGITDWRYIRSIHRRFGTRSLRTYPHCSLARFAYYVAVRRTKTISILNSIDYNKKNVVAELEREIGWRNYGGKHHESVYTRFFQSYILPRKFGIDKRRAHLSSLIMSGQLTRDQALAELALPIADDRAVQEDLAYVAKKFAMSVSQFEALLQEPRKTYHDYPNDERLVARLLSVARFAQAHGLLPPQLGM
jgi:N-acetyl sugar amidotransferase